MARDGSGSKNRMWMWIRAGGTRTWIALARSLVSSDRPHVLVSPMRVATNGAMSCGMMGSHTLPHSQVEVGKAWGCTLSEISNSFCEDVSDLLQRRAICLCPQMTGRQFHDNQRGTMVGRSVARSVWRSLASLCLSQSVSQSGESAFQ